VIAVPALVLFGVPILLAVGVMAGWKVAHLIDPDLLKVALGGVLFAVGPLSLAVSVSGLE
jgi:uncharacterized membrane protein YfcA